MDKDIVAKELANFMIRTNFKDIPENVIEKAKICLLDFVFVTIGGQLSDLPAVKIITEYAKEINGIREATIIGDGSLISCEYASMVNSIASEILELSDGDPKIIGHPGQAVIPSALAIGEKERINGSELVTAIVIGYDVMVRIGYAVMPSAFDRGLSASGCLGNFGAVSAASKILNLNEEEIISGFGLASFASGFRESWTGAGTMDKDLMVGEATRRGTLAAILAKKGFSGAANILEGKRGFCYTIANNVDFRETVKELGKAYKIMEQYLKAYPSCRHTHATIDTVLELSRKHNLKSENIKNIKIYLNQHAADIAVNAPTSYVGIRFSQQFAAAIALLEKRATLQEFTEEKAKDPKVRELMEKVEIIVDPILDKAWPEKWTCRVEITMTNGQVLSHHVDYPKGDVRNPMSEEDLREKFESLLMGRLSDRKFNEIVGKIKGIEKIKDIKELMMLLSV